MKLSLPLISQPRRFRRAVKAASFPSGEAKGVRDLHFTIQRTAQFRQLRADAIRPYILTRKFTAIAETIGKECNFIP